MIRELIYHIRLAYFRTLGFFEAIAERRDQRRFDKMSLDDQVKELLRRYDKIIGKSRK